VDDKNGASSAADDALGRGIRHRVLHTSVVVGGNDDQVRFQFFGSFANFLGWDATADQAVASAPRIELPPFDGVEMFLAPLYGARIRSQPNNRTVPKVRGGSDRFDHVQQQQPRAELAGERLRVARRDLRWRGEIDRQKDRSELDRGERGPGLRRTTLSRQARVIPGPGWFAVVPRFHGQILFRFSAPNLAASPKGHYTSVVNHRPFFEGTSPPLSGTRPVSGDSLTLPFSA